MSDKFIQVTNDFWVSPQISADDIARAAKDGFALIINNRPDGEMPGQPKSETLRAAAQAAGLGYAHIPVGSAGITPDHLSAHEEALKSTPGKTLAFCRSGTRSIFVAAYAAAAAGTPIDEIIAQAGNAGFDLSAHRPALENLAAASNS